MSLPPVPADVPADLRAAALPELPSMEELLKTAQERRNVYAELVRQAQAEVDKADEYINRLSGAKPRARSKPRQGQPGPASRWTQDVNLADTAYRAILEACGNHAYAGATTLAGNTSYAKTSVHRAMRLAVERGHAILLPQGRKHRWKVTEAGQDFLTRPVVVDADVLRQATGGVLTGDVRIEQADHHMFGGGN